MVLLDMTTQLKNENIQAHKKKIGEISNMSKKNQIYKEANFSIDPRYQIQSILGKGSYGTVCSAIDSKSSSGNEAVQLAIKKVSNIFKKEVLLKRAVRELKLMKHFKGHRNIVNLIDLDIVYITPYEGLYCVQELADYDLARVIYSSIQFSEFHIQNFIYQILCGLKYIHSADVIHRDLKPGNILVTIQGTLKICDFGLARGVNPKYFKQKATPITNYVATRWYRAPELMLSNRNYSKAVDLWAVGCILAELFGRRPLFVGKDQIEQLNEIFKVLGTPPADVVRKNDWKLSSPSKAIYKPVDFKQIYPFASDRALDLIVKLLYWDPSKRLDVNQALSHVFLVPVRDESNEPECDSLFDFKFEYSATTISDLKLLLQDEVESFKANRRISS
ncbi:Piso0_005005 [Millerozyma farinosa CBS 7064]|uniref:Piso0_005005 protein n=1 Tax=Pichia sorbitophila (strain ATCC MYA-4447 / BCRC 22081 / CBS 7064 / NBRC 10061 / NRRL Y-12695) TaxID=559304 RepID=G8Y107_PICSO|nr:Piso0_005005 [Millerozyma farinosa CBS 7064]